MEKIKTAFIGVGYRGKQLLQLLQTFPVFEVVAVADPGIEGVDISGVTCYNDGDDDYLNMLDRHKPELDRKSTRLNSSHSSASRMPSSA